MKYINYIFILLIITLSLSELKVFNVNINIPIGWFLLFILSFALISTSSNKQIFYLLIVFMIVFRILSLSQPYFYLFYECINGLFFFIAGLIVFSYKENEKIFFKQLLFILYICAPIMFLQMAGIPLVHYHNYANDIAINQNFKATLFQSFVTELDFAQYRPAGILYSGQPLGLLIVFLSAYLIFHKRELKWFQYFLISFVVVISTSYYVLFSYIIFLIAFLKSRRMCFRHRKLKILSGTLVGFLFFYLCFPGVYLLQMDRYDILNKVFVRLVDFQVSGIDIYKIPFVSEIGLTLFEKKGGELQHLYNEVGSTDYKAYSIFGKIINNVLLAIVIIFLCFIFIIRLIKESKKFDDPMIYSKIFTLFGLFVFSVINPQFDYSLFMFLLAFPMTVIFQKNFIKKYFMGLNRYTNNDASEYSNKFIYIN